MCISIWTLYWLHCCLIHWFLPLYSFSPLTSFINEIAHSVLGSCKSLKMLILTLLSTAQSLTKLVLCQYERMCVFTASLSFHKSMPQMWFHRKSVGTPRFHWMNARAETSKLYVTTTQAESVSFCEETWSEGLEEFIVLKKILYTCFNHQTH